MGSSADDRLYSRNFTTTVVAGFDAQESCYTDGTSDARSENIRQYAEKIRHRTEEFDLVDGDESRRIILDDIKHFANCIEDLVK